MRRTARASVDAMRAFLLVLALVVSSSAVLADILPPEAAPCDGKAIGDSCDGEGTCVESTCSRATPDGGVTYGCTLCKANEGSSDDGTTAKSGCTSTPVTAFGMAALLLLRRRR